LLEDSFTGVNVPLNEVFLKFLVMDACVLLRGRLAMARLAGLPDLLWQDFATPRLYYTKTCSRTGQAGMLNFSFIATFQIRHLTDD
jgi:hypothetical protein